MFEENVENINPLNALKHGGHSLSKIKFKDIPGFSRTFSAFLKDLG